MRRWGLLIVVVAALGLWVSASGFQSLRAQSRPNFALPALTLSLAQTELGEWDALNGSAVFENRGGVPAILLLPMDGADEGLRCVEYRWEVQFADGREVPMMEERWAWPFDPPRIRAQDFFTVAPGEVKRLPLSVLFSPEYHWDLSSPASYRTRLIYRYAPPDPAAPGTGPGAAARDDAALQQLLRDACRTTLASNWVEFTRE
ncbi:MAG: hypothetical protein ACYTGX_03555 [Planctomycetota bacterium]|jgi:hypothetical protein